MSATQKIVDRKQWLEARKKHLHDEKSFTHQREQLAEQRRQLPWVKVEKEYVFDGVKGPASLADLFEGRSQLLVYHFMFAPEWTQGCKSCSLVADHLAPTRVHLQHKDATLVLVSRAPLQKLQAFRERMGWDLKWVSSGNNSFNHDYGVYFSEKELENSATIYNYESAPYPITDLPGLSVFSRDAEGNVFHTYSTYARGLDIFLNVYNLLDVTPKGRDENGTGMAWVRHHDRYGVPGFVDPWMEAKAAK